MRRQMKMKFMRMVALDEIYNFVVLNFLSKDVKMLKK
jgi:hypothetical protein